MNITSFTAARIKQAAYISLQNYGEERGYVPALPAIDTLPPLDGFAADSLGVAAVDGGELLGFLCWQKPFDNHFGLCRGTWSPVHAHGAVEYNRAAVYDKLYQAAAEKLVADKVFSHAVTLYEHDAEANKSFAQNGFGRRCVDAVRETLPFAAPSCGLTFRQAAAGDAEALAEMRSNLSIHLSQPPMFMPFDRPFTAEETAAGIEDGYYQYFLAIAENRPAAYLRLQQSRENFAAEDRSMMNISGAYALPEFRGTGAAAGLLSWVMDWLRERGFSRCGVDFESFNYTARKFWLKYFKAYTNSLVRRIDERINQ